MSSPPLPPSQPPPAPPPLPPPPPTTPHTPHTTHTYCTSWGRETRRERGAEGEEGAREKRKQTKSHKLLEISLLRCEKHREGVKRYVEQRQRGEWRKTWKEFSSSAPVTRSGESLTVLFQRSALTGLRGLHCCFFVVFFFVFCYFSLPPPGELPIDNWDKPLNW